MKPNKENIRKWVDALRSGNYTQTRDHLADKSGFCCLGVACEVAINEGAPIIKNSTQLIFRYNKEDNLLPHEAVVFFGLSGNNPLITFPRRIVRAFGVRSPRVSLAELNDERLTLSQIADIIEWYYL